MATELSTVDQILAFAIAREEEAVAFYERLAQKTAQPHMQQTFRDFAAEERLHREKLAAIRAKGQFPALDRSAVADLKIADHTVVEPQGELDYPRALLLAMKREKAAFRLYDRLAALAPPALADVFRGLAREEARHKLKFEIEYDENVLIEN
jgi:rubrerythrin